MHAARIILIFLVVFVTFKVLEVLVIRPSMEKYPRAWTWALVAIGVLAVGYMGWVIFYIRSNHP